MGYVKFFNADLKRFKLIHAILLIYDLQLNVPKSGESD